MTRVFDEPLVLLHARPYRETSVIVSGFSLNHGKVSLLGRGMRRPRRGRLLQALSCYRVGWSGRSALLTLTEFEVELQPSLKGQELAAGFYVAELISRLVGDREPHPRLFAGTRWALENIPLDVEFVLRRFEKLLLEELGYGLDFEQEAGGSEPIRPDRRYRFDPGAGFTAVDSPRGYPGGAIRAIGRDDLAGELERKLAKRIFRQALAAHLGPRPLASRRLLFAKRQP